MHADQIDEPLLLIHGEVDHNPGTVPLQSEKLFEAVRGTGGTVRLVMLPHESHGYVSREAVEHVIAEQVEWFDKWVKNAGPRTTTPTESAAAQ
jgi:dipeptidyl aminopeptidase/acylaminoacyl peptidase